MLSSCHNGEGINVVKLSELHGDSWRDRKNRFGDRAMVDFALTEPFRLLSPESARLLRDTGESYFGTDHEFSTARTSACIRDAPGLEQLITGIRPQLEAMATRLVGGGLRMRLHNMLVERAHLNVQRTVQAHPVDNWHQDSTPFVLVTILTDHVDDSGGHLMVRRAGEEDDDYRCKLMRPGDAVLMQGSQIWHMAEQSEVGKRLTLVTSFFVDDACVFDPTSPRIALGYSNPTRVVTTFLRHAVGRLATNARRGRELCDLSRAAGLEANRILLLEVDKLQREFATGFDKIPLERRTTRGLVEAWAMFDDAVLVLAAARDAAAGAPEMAHATIGPAASAVMQRLLPLGSSPPSDEMVAAVSKL